MNQRPVQTQLIPYVRSTVHVSDLVVGAPVRSPVLSVNGDMTIEAARNGAIKFKEDDTIYPWVLEGKMIRFPIRAERPTVWTEPPLVRDLVAGDVIEYMGGSTRVHAISRRPNETFARVSIHDPVNRRRNVAYCFLHARATGDLLLNGDHDPWKVGIETAMGYYKDGKEVPLLVHPLGRGYWSSSAAFVEGASPTPKHRRDWEQYEFRGQFWTLRHPSDPARRPKTW